MSNTKLETGRGRNLVRAGLKQGGYALALASAIGGCTIPAPDNQMNGLGMAGTAAGVMGVAGMTDVAGMMGIAGTPASGGMGAAGMTGVAGTPASGGMGAAGDVASGGMGAAGDVASGGMGAGMVATGGMGAGMVATGGMGAGMDGTGGMGVDPPIEDKGEGDGMDVITMGDSYMRLDPTAGTELSLEKVSGRNYRNYGVAGTQVLTGQIPGQYTTAKGQGAIKTVVMSAGGNDILIGNIGCSVAWNASCNTTIDNTQIRLKELRDEMGADGVEDVIMVSYGVANNPSYRPGLEYAITIYPEYCKETDTPRCFTIDPREQLMGKIRGDGIHPTAEGYDILGQMVWDLMIEKGIRR